MIEQSTDTIPQKNSEIRKIRRYSLICGALWTLLMSGLTVVLVVDTHQKVRDIGLAMAIESFEKDLLFRRWAARHGGVYVPETVKSPSNPYLKTVPERDITIPSGKHLTLINPAYMTRQIYESAQKKLNLPQGHITSLNPIRSENAPDVWEIKALNSFEKGAKELVEELEINGEPFLRFMRPMKTEKACLKCHAAQGYKEGDVRGGISVSLPMADLKKTANREMWQEAAVHLFIWLLGLGLIGFGTRKIVRVLTTLSNEKSRLRLSEENLLKLKETLQDKNEELQINEESLREQNYELHTAEETLQEQLNRYEISQKQLKESESRFKAISEATFGGIIIHDQGLILECNDSISGITGYSREELIGMKGLKLIAPESLDLVMENILSGYDKEYEVKGVRKNGSIYPLLIKGKNIVYQGKKARVIEYRDITERKQMEEEKRNLEQQFHQAQKLESLGVLAGGIAHDFNNILTVIIGNCYMARENMLSGDEYKDAFWRVETAANRAADLCRHMLTYAGKTPSVQTKVNLWLLVDEDVKMLEAALKKNVTIERDLQADIPEITGDSGQLQQIVINLIINAAEAIGDANGVVKIVLSKICIEAEQLENDVFGTEIMSGNYVCLEVSDNGIGMDEETQKRIFEPFFTTKFTGRGLGMSAIHGIIKSHEGFLQLRSYLSVGTTFRVCFPIPTRNSYVENIAAVPFLFEKLSCTILLVEDEQALRDLGTNLLEAMGYTVYSAENGRVAVEMYQQRCSEFDVILLDLIMPVMGGIETYHEMRAIDPTQPIVICSGYGFESVEGVIKNDQHAAFVHKPYKPNELRDVIGRMIG